MSFAPTALPSRAVLELSGPDADSLLQGLVTQDLRQLDEASAVYSALLTPQGKFLHDFHIARTDGALLLDPEAARLPDLARRLTMYRLRAKVDIRPRPDLAVVVGDGAGGIRFADARLAALGTRGFVPMEQAPAVDLTALAAYEALRMRLGVPDGSRDIAVERMALLESNLDELQAIGWNKGCYVGQELTARTRHRGLVSRRILPVLDPKGTALPAPDTPLLLAGEEIGTLRGSQGALGLATIRLDRAPQLPGGPATATVDGIAVQVLRPDWLPASLLEPA